jgi:hypothetical protein
MYVERCSPNHDGPAWIGWVSFSKTGRTAYYRDLTLRRIPRGGVSGNHEDVETGIEYWLSGPKQNRRDRHRYGRGPVEIDDDARDEYARITLEPGDSCA